MFGARAIDRWAFVVNTQNAKLSQLFHLEKVMELVGEYPHLGDFAIIAMMKERGVPKGTTQLCLRAGTAIGIFWCKRPHIFSLWRRLVNV